MMKITLAGAVPAALMALAVGGCDKHPDAKHGADATQIAAAITADQAQLVTDFNAHDPAKSASHYGPDFVGMSHGAPNVIGPDADQAEEQKAVAADPTLHVEVTAPTIDVAASGDMAVYRATYTFTGTNGKTRKPLTETGNYVAGYKAGADGSWKIVWSVVSDTGPPPAAAKAPKSQKRGGNSA